MTEEITNKTKELSLEFKLCWSKLKQCLRTVKARTTEAINQALTKIINHQISEEDAVGWFEHCGLFI